MHEVERELARLRREIVVVFGPDGREILRREGTRDRVDLSDVPGQLLQGSVLTHNHPQGTSLSPQDVRFALTHRLGEIRAVTAGTVFSLIIPPDVTWDDIAMLVETLGRQIADEDRIAINLGQASPEARAAIYWHRVWEALADIRGWVYRQEEWGP